MSDLRVTLISDPTKEYPLNTNNSFKVRLPTRLVLEGGPWVGSLWNMSVPDMGHRAALIHDDATVPIIQFGYTLTRRVQDPLWQINFIYREKKIKLPDVMSSEFSVVSGTQFWRNIVTRIEQIIMEDVNTASVVLKASKNDSATVSLKKEWKPTFEWKGDNLVLKAVNLEDLFSLDTSSKKRPLSKLQILIDVAKKFGLIVKTKEGHYELGPNLEFTLPVTTYTNRTQLIQTNQRYQWLGEHYVGVTPADLLGGNDLFKVVVEGGNSFLQLSCYVDWTFKNLNAMFNDQVGDVNQTALVYCDAMEPTIIGSQMHALLRTVELKRSGQGRLDIEPLHREWIPLRNTIIESIEVSIATTSGSLLPLPIGKTLITLGFKKL